MNNIAENINSLSSPDLVSIFYKNETISEQHLTSI